MQRVSAFLPSWEKRHSSSKGSIGSIGGARFGWSNRSSASSNGPKKLDLAALAAASSSGRVYREAYWPATLDLECDKAARILKSFCRDGYLAPLNDETRTQSPSEAPQTPTQITQKIPKRIIQNAAGIAVFSCMRSGLWMTGSGGSGILIARKSDGSWSPPSGIMLHTPTLSFIIGVDIYDCVLVVNNLAALESITRPRVTLGEDVGLTGGPSVPLDATEADIKFPDLGNTVLAYMKARGQHQNVNLNGCILAERGNENERFYSTGISQMDILAGNVNRHVEETTPLFEVIKMAEGRNDFDQAIVNKLASQLAPGDAVISSPKDTPASPRGPFGVPNANDPDPFGVLALEMAGMEIREAGTRLRPTSSQFEFNTSAPSPTTSRFSRQSADTFVTRSNRGSYMSTRTTKSQVTDAGTQTDVANTPHTTPSPGQSEVGHERSTPEQAPLAEEPKAEAEAEAEAGAHDEVDYTTVDMGPLKDLSRPPSIHSATSEDRHRLQPGSTDGLDKVSKASSHYEHDSDTDNSFDFNDADDEDDLDEEPVVFEVAAVQPARTQAVASRVVHAKGSMVTIPKRIPPPLPARSAARTSRINHASKSEIPAELASQPSPLRQEFSESDIKRENDEASQNSEATSSEAVSQKEEPSPTIMIEDCVQDSRSTNAAAGAESETAVMPEVSDDLGSIKDGRSTPSVVIHEPKATPALSPPVSSDEATFEDAEIGQNNEESSPETRSRSFEQREGVVEIKDEAEKATDIVKPITSNEQEQTQHNEVVSSSNADTTATTT